MQKYNFKFRYDEKYGSDIVDMKCLECDYEDVAELMILLEFDRPYEPCPVLTCPKCDHDLFVPKDVYDQIKGGFIYK